MFRSLRDTFEKKKRILEKQVSLQKKAFAIVARYAGPVEVVYDSDQQLLKIQTKSKTVASELLVQAGEIGAVLRTEGIAVRQLIIR